MKTRYDFMKQSDVQDPEDKSFYPDVLSLNLNTFRATQPLTPVEVSDLDLEKFWWTTQRIYGTAELDDVVLSLNGIPHRNLLKEGDIVFFPAAIDIELSLKNQR